MTPDSLRRLATVLCSGALLAGCGPVDAPAPTEERSPVAPDSPAAHDVEERIGTYMPPLEGGSLEIAAPKGWAWVRPGHPYLVAFTPARASINDLPRILMSTEASPYPGFEDVTPEDADRFQQAVQTALGGPGATEKPPTVVVLGGKRWVEYQTLRRSRDRLVSCLVLETVANGRWYQVRLEALQRQLAQNRPDAYAVAASCRFSASDEAAETESLSLQNPLVPPG